MVAQDLPGLVGTNPHAILQEMSSSSSLNSKAYHTIALESMS